MAEARVSSTVEPDVETLEMVTGTIHFDGEL